jgi:hypothetical protein
MGGFAMISPQQLVFFYYALFVIQILEIVWYVNRRHRLPVSSAKALRWVFMIAYVMLAGIGIYAHISQVPVILVVTASCLGLGYYLMFVDIPSDKGD